MYSNLCIASVAQMPRRSRTRRTDTTIRGPLNINYREPISSSGQLDSVNLLSLQTEYGGAFIYAKRRLLFSCAIWSNKRRRQYLWSLQSFYVKVTISRLVNQITVMVRKCNLRKKNKRTKRALNIFYENQVIVPLPLIALLSSKPLSLFRNTLEKS